ncbi:CHD5-like protein-domain-containing protein [Russula earlei]|uniref:CHD5-like protein-domain-containing protein n=1 Tax=Russula earlei TaxID=71964 RepID=A0ACC0UCG5_9AGAM|nr:CHD5-like protein-domain-containing protein [Russula earlei]
MTLILTIFALVFITELTSWVGKSVLLQFAWTTYQQVFNRSTLKRQRELKSELLSKKTELLQTSAQDHFAKWAKLRRSVDKGLADLEKLNSELSVSKSSFALKFNTTLWMLTTGLQFAIGWWYSRSPVFYLPTAWLGPFTWWLSLPFAPTGSVSCGVWQMACRRIIKAFERVVKEFMNSHQEQGTADEDDTEFSRDRSTPRTS